MKKLLTLIFISSVLTSAAQDPKPEWQNEKILSVGQEKPRARFMSYHNRNIAANNDYTQSEFCLSLNKTWQYTPHNEVYRNNTDEFHPIPIEIPTRFERTQGKGNLTPPNLPQPNPSDLYRTDFEIPLGWLDRDVFLHIGQASSGVYVYLNGNKVGYSENLQNGGEFLLNKHITDGQNVISLEVYHRSTSSYLEFGNRKGGISGDVYIYSQPKTRIEDFYVTQSLENDYTDGLFKLDICMTNNFNAASGPMQIWYELENADGVMIDYSYKEIAMTPHSRDTVSFERVLKDINKWSAEDPYLYKLVLKIRKNGRFVEYTSQNVGFRTSEIAIDPTGRSTGMSYLINGEKVLVRGVNLDEAFPINDGMDDEAEITETMRQMKQMNINAIYFSNHPRQRLFYELADKYGFYICDRANIDSHGTGSDLRRGGSLANNPEWLDAYIERTQIMYHHAKNYPSVVSWSLGTADNNGYNFYKTYNWLKNEDQLRPIQFAGAGMEWNTDILCPIFTRVIHMSADIKRQSARPTIFAQYNYKSSDFDINFKDLWHTITSSAEFPEIQGGYVDLSLCIDRNEKSDQQPVTGKNITTPEHSFKTYVKQAYLPIQFREADLGTGKIHVQNLNNVTNTSIYEIRYAIKSNTKIISSNVLSLSIAPNGTSLIVLPVSKLKPTKGVEYSVHLEAKLKANNGLLKKGFIVASEQFVLPIR